MDTRPALGIDVGGGSAKIGLVSPNGTMLARGRVDSDPDLDGLALLDRYLETASRLQREAAAPDLRGIGIGLPGHIDADAGTTRACNVPQFDDLPIVAAVRARAGVETRIENDATLAALGEYRFGAGRDCARFMTVTLGTGIGVGFLVAGRPVHTSNGTLGDIGHVIVDPKGAAACRQGCHGCLESVASGLALAERFAALGRKRSGDSAAHPLENEAGLGPLFRLASAGDPACLEIIADAARAIGAGIATWMHIFAPDRIALSGGVAAAGAILLDRVAAETAALAIPSYMSRVQVVPAMLGTDAGVIGAAALCL